MRNMVEKYARKVCELGELKEGVVYGSETLNQIVVWFPAGLLTVDKGWEDLPRIGQEVSLQSHMQNCFFGLLDRDDAKVEDFVQPFLISLTVLTNIRAWQDWLTLESFLVSLGMMPTLVFRAVLFEPEGCDEYCLQADLRVAFVPGYTYHYVPSGAR